MYRETVVVAWIALSFMACTKSKLPVSDEDRSAKVAEVELSRRVREIVAGRSHSTCAVMSAGGVKCWGNNTLGRLGVGSNQGKETRPVDLRNSADIISVRLGFEHGCGVTAKGRVKCWGENRTGQLGIGSEESTEIPTEIPELSGVIGLSLGEFHTCALSNDGHVWCWGGNVENQLGRSNEAKGPGLLHETSPVLVQSLSDVTAIAAGDYHTCALTKTGRVWCWGNSGPEDIHDGSETAVEVTSPRDTIGIAAGMRHTCYLARSGAVECWGWNEDGELGDGSNKSRNSPVGVKGLPDAVMLSGSGTASCAVTARGLVYCWGWGGDAGLGDGSGNNVPKAVQVSGLSGISAVSAGTSHFCALTRAGAAWCWGENKAGQIGDGTTEDRLVPVEVKF